MLNISQWLRATNYCQTALAIVLLCITMYVQVLEKVSPNPREVKCVAAQNNPSKNRSTEFLPGIYGLCQTNECYLTMYYTVDRWRVILKGETPDYINATVVHVSNGLISKHTHDMYKHSFMHTHRATSSREPSS